MDSRSQAETAYTLNHVLHDMYEEHGNDTSAIVVGQDASYMVTQLYARRKECVASLSACSLLSATPKVVVLASPGDLADELALLLPMMHLDDYLCLIDRGEGVEKKSLEYLSSIRSNFHYLSVKTGSGTLHLLTRHSSVLAAHTDREEQDLSKVEFALLFDRRYPSKVPAPWGGCKKPVRGWLHVACMGAGELIASEMHGRLRQSGLLDLSSKVMVSLLGDPSAAGRLQSCVFNAAPYSVVGGPLSLDQYEWPALTDMWDAAQAEDFYAYYVHTKGASNGSRPDVPAYIQGNIRDWRDCMSHFVIGKHRDAMVALDSGSDAAGALYYPCVNPGLGGMYGGNFWWTTADHLRRLPDPRSLRGSSGEARMAAERWVCSLDSGKYHNMYWSESGDPYDFPSVYLGQGGPLGRRSYANG